MTDIVERLRAGFQCDEIGNRCRTMNAQSGCVCAEAADEIERLRAALREDARDFADRIELLEELVKRAQSIIDPCCPEKCHQWQKDARAALEGKP